MKNGLLKGTLTVLLAASISAIGIFASDTLQEIDRDLLGLGSASRSGVCRSGMVPIQSNENVVCVDVYEASPGEGCPHTDPANMLETEKNVESDTCYAASVADVDPWRFVSLAQAQRMCASAGKRLPTPDEWYRFALGVDTEHCVIDNETPQRTGNNPCASAAGVYDTVGNVWEWVDTTITHSNYNGRSLPEEGYVASVDSSGIAITSADAPDVLYEEDYFWSESEGVFGMIRGGFYGSGPDAGLYAVNASVPTDFASQGVGFRCVEDMF